MGLSARAIADSGSPAKTTECSKRLDGVQSFWQSAGVEWSHVDGFADWKSCHTVKLWTINQLVIADGMCLAI